MPEVVDKSLIADEERFQELWVFVTLTFTEHR